ncbi:MAG: hypothetical protein [Olavius algarvensis Delta 4 endosymbiont]|nr:MAG: hypothetical protein [Olavius algarvensis Delta 4 endosymbiont]
MAGDCTNLPNNIRWAGCNPAAIRLKDRFDTLKKGVTFPGC